MTRRYLFGMVWIGGMCLLNVAWAADVEFAAFFDKHVRQLAPLETQVGQAFWDGATTGDEKTFRRQEELNLRIKALYSDPNAFRQLKIWHDSEQVQRPELQRQLHKLLLRYRQHQVDPNLTAQIVQLDTRIQEVYSKYRAQLDGRSVTMSDIYTLFTTEQDLEKREAVWRASKQVGNVIIEDLLQLVRLRNRAARQVGYANYHQMMVESGEQSVAEIDALFDELDRLTAKPFSRLKADVDQRLAQGYGIDPTVLKPWHYHDPFFQRSPLVFDIDLDTYYQGRDLKALAERYFAGIGLPIAEILTKSDLYDREGKYPHAFSHEIGREGDVRILCNLQDTERWAETLLHELGHAVYSQGHDRSAPWLFREPAHSFVTEAVAMFFGRLSRNADWMQLMLGLSDTERAQAAQVSGRYLQFQQILFARWALVMYTFEKALYADPNQDLNTLWWELVARYQEVQRPDGQPDAGWASKLHFATAPCYYHNYLLGELLASQFQATVLSRILPADSKACRTLAEDKRIGAYFQEQVFAPGSRYPWQALVQRATGEPLTAKYFVEQFLGELAEEKKSRPGLDVRVCGGGEDQAEEHSRLTLERIFDSNDLKVESVGGLNWLEDGSGYTHLEDSNDCNEAKDIVFTEAESGWTEIWVSARHLIPPDGNEPLAIESYAWSHDHRKVLIFTNAKQVWRQKTRGDYWVLDRDTGDLWRVGGKAIAAHLKFAKFSPDTSHVAYVYQNNLYVQSLRNRRIRQLTRDGSSQIINGTSDWVNEEELGLRDGYRWSPDGNYIAYWQFDTQGVESMTLINNTEHLYPRVTSFAYPKAGQTNSSCRVGVVSRRGGGTRWIPLPGDPREHYIPVMDWREHKNELVIHQLNRLQNRKHLFLVSVKARPFGRLQLGKPWLLFTELDEAWLAAKTKPHWLGTSNDFLWLSERDGWRHLYRVEGDTGSVDLLSPGAHDVIDLVHVDEQDQWVYVMASPENPTQRYLYRLPLAGGKLERLSPSDLPGTHSYRVDKQGRWAIHSYSSTTTPPRTSLIHLHDHQVVRMLEDNEKLRAFVDTIHWGAQEFFRVPIHEDTKLDGWCLKPPGFDPQGNYPVLFYVYGEPAGQTVLDKWPKKSAWWHRYLAQQGFIVISVDNRGTPAPRGRDWRKCIYRQIGILTSEDQALAVKQLLQERPYLDPERVGVWGWSGGGSMTLNALFRYPDLYQVGIAVAFVSDLHYYDTIYQERYMGLPKENEQGYRDGSPIMWAEQLAGNLLLVYGTGDDNCHYQNCEALVNKLVELNKPFQLMSYPNRRHGIRHGKNTSLHLYTLMTDYLEEHLKDQ